MLLVFEPSHAMIRFPIVNQDFGMSCFLTKRPRQTAMVFVCMSKHDPANIRDKKTGLAKPRAQCRRRFSGLWPGIDERDWVGRDQIHVHRTDVEGGGKGDG